MNYKEWVRDELRELSKSLGFRYTPDKEIEGRISRLREAMETQGMDALLVVQKMGGTEDRVPRRRSSRD